MSPVSSRTPSMTLPQRLHARQRRRTRERRNPAGRLGLVAGLLLSLAATLVVLPLALAYIGVLRGLPSLQALPQYLEPPNGWLLQPTRLYDQTGQHVLLSLENPAAAGRKYLFVDEANPDHFSPLLIQATIAVTDPTFWHNPGYTLEGWQQGTHPTIAQRLVSDLLLWNESPGWRRNLRERFLASQITSHYGRQKVLEWYLNSARYGRWIYGADAAARVYFGKSAADLNLAEATMLAAVAEAPALNPIDAPQAAQEQQRQVLQAMLIQGLITVDEVAQASQTPLNIQPASEALDLAPAFTNLALEQLAARFPVDRLERGGLRVITSLDYDLQLQAACTALAQIARLEGTEPVTTAADGQACQAARLLPTLSVLSATGEESLSGLSATVAVLDPNSGQILALVGNPVSGSDPAHLPGRPPGTILNPFIYFFAFTYGDSPASLQWDIPLDKADQGEFHGPVRARIALANDYLSAAIQTLSRYRPENVWRTARQFGLSSLREPDNQLQGGEMTLLEGVHAYGVFANQGVLTGWEAEQSAPSQQGGLIPWTVLRLEDTAGQVLFSGIPQARPLASSQLAYLLTNVLSDEAARWPSLGHPNSLEIGRPAAAKLGRTQAGNDAWTIGYIPQMVVGVWMGRSESSTETPASPPSGVLPASASTVASADSLPESAAALWHAVIQYASRNLPAKNWEVPSGIQSVTVCDPSGMLPTENCPATVSEVFLPDHQPVQADTLFRSVQINRENGRLATVFTPPDLLETKVFIDIPSAAEEWARQAGLPTMPNTYDVIRQPQTASPDVVITTPEMFTTVRGQVTFTGRAAGKDFDRYSLQVGAGLNPQQWIMVAQDVRKQVQDGVLGVWDTDGKSGLYAVQLQVIRQNQIVDLYITEVTVDNQPPEVTILSPREAEQISRSKDGTVILSALANDDLTLASLSFFVDDQPIVTLIQAPFAVLWQAKPGDHVLRVLATDLAGNTQEASVAFTVK
jgi:membrane peptidoglycan carboxypeptidase